MSKWMAVMMLGAAMVCGCDSMCKNKDKDDMDSTAPKKMSVDKSAKSCPMSCDKADKAK